MQNSSTSYASKNVFRVFRNLCYKASTTEIPVLATASFGIAHGKWRKVCVGDNPLVHTVFAADIVPRLTTSTIV
jgi:hypothetical protein